MTREDHALIIEQDKWIASVVPTVKPEPGRMVRHTKWNWCTAIIETQGTLGTGKNGRDGWLLTMLPSGGPGFWEDGSDEFVLVPWAEEAEVAFRSIKGV